MTSSAEPDTGREEGSRTRGRILARAVSALAGLLAVLMVVGTAFWLLNRPEEQQIGKAQNTQLDRAAERRAYLDFAKDAARQIVTIDGTDPGEYTRRLEQIGTGQFKDDLATNREALMRMLPAAQVRAVGTVRASGVEQMTDRQAAVLVAVTLQVSNVNQAGESPRFLRLRMTVDKVDDGQLKVSRVEPVV